MARPSKTEPKEKDATPSPEEILGAYLNDKDNKSKHCNNVEQIDYRVSTGSLMWDIYSGGGLPPGMHRFIGPPESGKSSSALEVCRNFLAKLPNSRGLYIKAEGKLPKEMRERCGLKFVWNYEEWKDGTIFVLESNNYEFIINLLRRLLIVDADKQTHYFCIIFDSMDGLVLDGDVKKESGENNKVAGAPKLTKEFLQKMGNYIGIRGHLCLMLGQYSTNISLETYTDAQNRRSKFGGGGWAAGHWAHFVFNFGEAFNGDLIKEREKDPASPTNPIYGKYVKVRFLKSPNEKTGLEISYPVKYGITGKSSVWVALEVWDVIQMMSLVTKKGSWLALAEKLRDDVKEGTKIEMPEQLQGEKNWTDWLGDNEAVVAFLYEKFKKTLIAEQSGSLDDETEES